MSPRSRRTSPVRLLLIGLLGALGALVLVATAAMLHPPTAERVDEVLPTTETVRLRVLPNASGEDPGPEGTALTAALLQRHLDALDAAWTEATPIGEDTIEVAVRSGKGAERVVEFLRGFDSARELYVHPVVGAPGHAAEPTDADSTGPTLPDQDGVPLRLGSAALFGGDVERTGVEHVNGEWMVTVDLTEDAVAAWRELTAEAACHEPGDPRRRIAVVLDGTLVSAPEIGPDATCGTGLETASLSVLSPGLTEEAATALARDIRAAALPHPVEVVGDPTS
ncbi:MULTISPECIES: hypothetical protein [unclassified Nocardiopsis]|uniref:SecDF P1 head subdomain-containing protein n=1 Tax=unclassified Nocardiopsis TaxID=2649073 RepID=UPI00135C5F32|nr:MULTISPECIES: hypothetical protein [unclassified Nocardiopsis]